MTTLYQSSYFTSVHRNGGIVTAKSHLLSTGWEAVAAVSVAPETFRIQSARWDTTRSPGGAGNCGRDVPGLLGVEAYLGAGPALRDVLQADGELAYTLLAECVKGIIQSETYLFRERGFPDAETYEAFWKKNYAGSCHLYSNIPRISRTWYDHVATRAWTDNLFNRFKTASVTREPGGATIIRGSFSDSFHELALTVAVAEDLVTACDGSFLRAPDPVCLETTANLAALAGRPVAELTKRFIGGSVGGPAGCSHMADLLLHMVRTVQEARG